MGEKWRKSKVSKYDMSSGTLVRKSSVLIIMWAGIFLAVHEDRVSCRRCGYNKKSGDSDETISSEEE